MPKLNDLKSDLIALYMSTPNSIDRFNILHQFEILIQELRKTGAELAMKPQIADDDTFVGIRNIILDQVGRLSDYDDAELIKRTDRFNDVVEKLRLDSLDTIEVVMEIEQAYDVELQDSELDLMSTGNCTMEEFAIFVQKQR
ncbi:hypothetical protein DQT32_05030 [Salmonella enterica subsp. enterica serovar Braenderup]|nr:hypothetical protein [Salmonella enterica subsp. enterica serovar Braenderup]